MWCTYNNYIDSVTLSAYSYKQQKYVPKEDVCRVLHVLLRGWLFNDRSTVNSDVMLDGVVPTRQGDLNTRHVFGQVSLVEDCEGGFAGIACIG